jgi:Mg2+ and Co2+ transporter CorA
MKRENEKDGMHPDQIAPPETMRETNTPIRIASWQDWDAIAGKERAGEMQQLVDDIFREELMGGLALLLIPILLLLDFVPLTQAVYSFLTVLDVAIWIFFILEYACRLLVAHDRYAYITSPWNILYLVIIGVPAIALVAGTGYGISRYFQILRSMQAFQVLYLGVKRAKMHLAEKPPGPGGEEPTTWMRVRALPITRDQTNIRTPLPVPAWSPVTLGDVTTNLNRKGLWIDFSGYTRSDLPTLSALTHIPPYLLEVKLRERAYPRAEMDGKIMTVFLQIPVISENKSEYRLWEIRWSGLLVGYDKDGVMTFSRTAVEVLDQIITGGPSAGIPLTGPGILYLVVNNALSTIEDLILSAEEQLLYLETQPMNRLPQNFLSMMYVDQKELGRINSGLMHTKTALEYVYNSDPEVYGMDEVEMGRLHSLIDRCSLLSENAQHVSDSFAWMVDFYLNTTSYSMNRVMKILAVLTALTMVPALVGGLLGMNLVGNPWPATLLQTVSVVALVMLLTAWIYFNLGWLKR